MLRVRPADVVSHIDSTFRDAAQKQANKERFYLGKDRAGVLRGIVNLVSELDPALLPSGQDHIHLISAVSAIEAELDIWNGGGSSLVEKTPGVGDENPVLVIRRIMESLPNEVIPPAARRLQFVADKEYREELERDLVSVESLMRQEEWKAVMTIAGGLAEALLLEAILQHPKKAIDTERQGLEQKKNGVRFRDPDPLWWDFHHYALIADRLGIVRPRTRDLALAAADGRNLVHPGKAIRQKEKPSRASALAIVATLEAIIADRLSPAT